MTYIVPTLIFIIGISDAIHIQARFKEHLSQDNASPKDSLLLTMLQMSKVIFLTSITTSIGFIALTTTSISIVQEFGLEISLGVMIAWLVSIIIVPSGIMLFKSFDYNDTNSFSPLLDWLSNVILKKPWLFIIIPLIISFISMYKIKDLSTDASLLDDLRPQNKLYQDLKMTENLAPLIAQDTLVISESGLYSNKDLLRMRKIGINSFLVGESLMRQQDVEGATRQLLGI